ncbi:MAG: hypothetical protein ACI32B_03180 [Erysipelotrichaceae bacterium]
MTHHRLGVRPIRKEVLYVNEPELADRSLFDLRPNKPKVRDDNIRIYVPLDLNKEAFIRRLEDIVSIYKEVSYDNESNFYLSVCMLIQQMKIYDQIWKVRTLSDSGNHSTKSIELVKEFIAVLESMPDNCAEYFSYDVIDDLKKEYL